MDGGQVRIVTHPEAVPLQVLADAVERLALRPFQPVLGTPLPQAADDVPCLALQDAQEPLADEGARRGAALGMEQVGRVPHLL
jgi:hypothetical protein